MNIVRKAVYAGPDSFYPNDSEELLKIFRAFSKDGKTEQEKKSSIKGLVLPHAGYRFSGAVAAQTVRNIELKTTIILIGPNHTGLGKHFSVMTEGIWESPLGNVIIDTALATKMVEASSFLEDDPLAHLKEHSLEVLIPFLQREKKDFKIVPIALAHTDFETYKVIADDILRAVQTLRMIDNISIVASSDMTHFEPKDSAAKKDFYVIDAIKQLDAKELLFRVREKKVSMCGAGPVAVMLLVVKALGAKAATLIHYQTSGDVTGDNHSVVGYAGIRVY